MKQQQWHVGFALKMRDRKVLVAAALLCLGYIAGWALSPLVAGSTLNDLDLYFWPSAQIGAHGHPLQAYSVQTFDNYPNANGPLGLLLLMPMAAVANAMGWGADLRVHAGMVGVVAAGFALLLSGQVLRLVEEERGRVEWRLATLCLVLLSPLLWMSIAEFGHIEQVVELFFMVLSVRMMLRGRCAAAGVALGLALLARTTAALFIVPLLLLLIGGRNARSVGVMLAAGTATVVAVLAPFLFVDGRDVVHSLVTFRGALPVGGGSILLAFRAVAEPTLHHADTLLIFTAAVGFCGLAVWRRSAVTSAAGVSGMLCVAALCFPMLAKTVYPYYVLEPYVLALLWWLARHDAVRSWRAGVPLLLTVDAFLANWGTHLTLAEMGVVEGVLSSVVLAGAAVLVVADLRGAGGAARLQVREAAAAAPAGWR